jgi:Pyruvate/2-oxoacid:ferredoxin oxidoreductase gamma subunit
VDDADIAVILNEASLKKFGPKVKEGGTLLYNEVENASEIINSFERQFKKISIPLRDLGSERYHNMIALGALLQIEPELNGNFIKEALAKEMKKRGRENLVQENLKSIQAGSDWYRAERGK